MIDKMNNKELNSVINSLIKINENAMINALNVLLNVLSDKHIDSISYNNPILIDDVYSGGYALLKSIERKYDNDKKLKTIYLTYNVISDEYDFNIEHINENILDMSYSDMICFIHEILKHLFLKK